MICLYFFKKQTTAHLPISSGHFCSCIPQHALRTMDHERCPNLLVAVITRTDWRARFGASVDRLLDSSPLLAASIRQAFREYQQEPSAASSSSSSSSMLAMAKASMLLQQKEMLLQQKKEQGAYRSSDVALLPSPPSSAAVATSAMQTLVSSTQPQVTSLTSPQPKTAPRQATAAQNSSSVSPRQSSTSATPQNSSSVSFEVAPLTLPTSNRTPIQGSNSTAQNAPTSEVESTQPTPSLAPSISLSSSSSSSTSTFPIPVLPPVTLFLALNLVLQKVSKGMDPMVSRLSLRGFTYEDALTLVNSDPYILHQPITFEKFEKAVRQAFRNLAMERSHRLGKFLLGGIIMAWITARAVHCIIGSIPFIGRPIGRVMKLLMPTFIMGPLFGFVGAILF